jgi:hypothetical protein
MKAGRTTEGGQKADEESRPRRNSTGSFSGGVEGERVRDQMKVGYAVWLTLALLMNAGCRSGTSKIEVLHGRVARVIRVDSEHGALNGVFSPKIIFDVYLDVNEPNQNTVKLLLTEKTQVYEQKREQLENVPVDSLKGGEDIEASVGDFDKRYKYPETTASKIVILKRR